jgi:hypothetical protein
VEISLVPSQNGSVDTIEPWTLRHRRNELVRRQERALERVALFPNAVNEHQLKELSNEIAAIDEQLRNLQS